jgi:DNA-binding MltR family transcriptional regulator
MGLISESVYHDLNVIRKIRNKFAHEMQGYTFNEPEIVDWCKTLKLAKLIADVTQFPKLHEDLFVFGVIQLVSVLGLKIIETENTHSHMAKDPEMAQVVRVD